MRVSVDPAAGYNSETGHAKGNRRYRKVEAMRSSVTRRQYLIWGSAALGACASAPLVGRWLGDRGDFSASIYSGLGGHPTYSIIPIVGDGKWIWREPPAEGTGYLEQREFEVRVGVTATAELDASPFRASTVAPTAHPEQEILDVRLETSGCAAELQTLCDTANQLAVAADRIAAGQTITAEAIFRIRLAKSYLGYVREQFPAQQSLPRTWNRRDLGDSPGIETKLDSLRKIVEQVAGKIEHPWDKAQAFHAWVHENIKGVPGDYTSVRKALQTRRGDCEERAGVFVALCRASGIPARLVWVPNHAWAEFLLIDQSERLHWIPAHTAAYSWFGWTGAHEVILQKGDKIFQPGLDENVRLVKDWFRCGGVKPKITYTAKVIPLADASDPQKDPGPGERSKQPDGKWVLIGKHAADRHMRD